MCETPLNTNTLCAHACCLYTYMYTYNPSAITSQIICDPIANWPITPSERCPPHAGFTNVRTAKCAPIRSRQKAEPPEDLAHVLVEVEVKEVQRCGCLVVLRISDLHESHRFRDQMASYSPYRRAHHTRTDTVLRERP
jgi:hypothetical protein